MAKEKCYQNTNQQILCFDYITSNGHFYYIFPLKFNFGSYFELCDSGKSFFLLVK